MTNIELLRLVCEWLPAAFVLDVLVFHFIGDHPLALAWWWTRPGSPSTPLELV